MWIKRHDPYQLIVGMTGVKLGDRFVQIGCAHGGRLAAVAAKVGLSGRAVAIVSDEASARRAQKAAESAGVLVEVETGPPTRLSADDAAFDIAVIDDSGGFFSALSAADRTAAVRELARVVRPGGRLMIVGSTPRQGLAALLSRGSETPALATADAVKWLEADGFRGVRTLAAREGLVFVEGIRPRTT
jgi:ubiquinone/menaquinone biosynthesis C-methylase UbiE